MYRRTRGKRSLHSISRTDSPSHQRRARAQGVVRKQSPPCHAPGCAEEGLVVLVHEVPRDRVLAPRYPAPQMINPVLN